jgi:alkylation response protein AidB-like acyl-CoA dehydrogenase
MMFADSDYKDFRAQVREFCEAEVVPQAVESDHVQKFDENHVKKLADAGYLKILLPQEYGGMGYNTIQYSIIVEELSRVCGSTGLMIAAHNSLGAGPIFNFGTEEQRRKYLTPVAEDGVLIAFGLTEPQAGSDAGGTRSYAEKREDGYLLNGTKCWITSAILCKYAVATARTDKSGGVKGITSFILEKGMEGFSIGKKENKLGCRGSDTAYLHFDDVVVPEANRLGEEGQGFKQFMMTLDGGRISIAAMALGLAVGAFEVAAKYAATEQIDDQPLGFQQGYGFTLADMYTQIEAARGLIYGAAQMKDRGERFSTQSAMAKLYAAEVCNFVTGAAMRLLGMDGISEKYPVERMFRDMKLTEIGEGTSEVQRLVISRALLKAVGDK